jgi:hypothetical protein
MKAIYYIQFLVRKICSVKACKLFFIKILYSVLFANFDNLKMILMSMNDHALEHCEHL